MEDCDFSFCMNAPLEKDEGGFHCPLKRSTPLEHPVQDNRSNSPDH